MKLYHINATNGGAELILSEYVGNTAGTFDGAAYDAESGNFYFVNINTNELWVNLLEDQYPSTLVGSLDGDASSATFLDNTFYYVDGTANTIKGVTIFEGGTIASETILDTIPGSITVNDIAITPDGQDIYMLGEVNGGGKELISWDVPTETFYSMSITVTSGAQIAFGSDGFLYVIATIVEGGSHSLIYTIDINSGILVPIDDDVIIIDDPFSDITIGPLM